MVTDIIHAPSGSENLSARGRVDKAHPFNVNIGTIHM